MQYLSTEYKQAMKSLSREITLMKVNIGLINQRATEGARVKDYKFTYFSNVEKPLKNNPVVNHYATYESDYSYLDKSMYFLPRGGGSFYNAGIVSEDLCTESNQPEIFINFETETGDPIDLKGLTIDFGLSWPTKFEIETDEGTTLFSNNAGKFVTEEVFSNVSYMKIKAVSMNKKAVRFRIEMITFGIGIVYDGQKIISGNLKSTISPVSEALPTIDFSVVIDNEDQYFNVDNKDSALNFMETGQQIDVYMGQTLLDRETIVWQKAATLNMKEWGADDRQATFTAVDKFEYMQDKYKKGEYRAEGIALYDLAQSVCEDAGLIKDEYWLDPYLRKVIVNNPLPAIEHKECLQLIANTGRCVLMQNRDGTILLKSSFIPDISISANREAEYSDVNELLAEDEEYNEYISYEKDFGMTNSNQFFLPKNKKYLRAGYTSALMSDKNGEFKQNPIIIIALESAYTFFGLTLVFGSICPDKFIIRTYNNGVKKGQYGSRDISLKTVINYDFIDIDLIEIEFVKTKPYNKVHISRILFGDATDYEMTYDKLIETPKGTMLEKIKELNVIRTVYTKGNELKDLSQENIILGDEVSEYEFEFSNPVYGLSAIAIVNDAEYNCGAKIIESGSYHCKVIITKPPANKIKAILTIKGYEYNISTITKKRKLNNVGKIVISDNPLISSDTAAENALEWIGNYYRAGAQYELSHRGEPALDCNDLFKLESKHSTELMARIEDNETIFEGGIIKGKILARREE